MKSKPNIILIVTDTLRKDYLGCYGNKKIITPNIDAFAKESVIFDNVYPESLPTIPVRRALHTGRRAFPFNDYIPPKWCLVYLPGWQAISNDEDTLAENLAGNGYYTGFVTDTMPYFSPGLNFTRGFWQWEFIRGQGTDKWSSIGKVPKGLLEKYGDPEEIFKGGKDRKILKKMVRNGDPGDEKSAVFNYYILLILANRMYIRSEEDITTARVFRWASDFIDDNRNLQPFYLLIDCFEPHEPWEAPQSYLEMYADKNYDGKNINFVDYGPVTGKYNKVEIQNIKANYSAQVTLLDKWFGFFIQKLKKLGLWDNSLIIFTSDHGTNFADNPDKIIGKPHYSMYPGLMKVPGIMKLPNKKHNGQHFDQLIYNFDFISTIYESVGINVKSNNINIDGKSLFPLVSNNKWVEREYLTCIYGDSLWYRDNNYWIIMNINGEPLKIFDIKNDPECKLDILDKIDDKIIKMAWEKLLIDADGEIKSYGDIKKTDAVGR